MILVRQDGYPDACQQSVIAMLANVGLQDVIAIVGKERLGYSDRCKALTHFDIEMAKQGYIIESFGNQTIGALKQEHKTMWLSISDCLNPSFGHSALLHQDLLYDPYYGMNPCWQWSHYISQATPVEKFVIA